MKSVVISIPVHEEPTVVENHLYNIRKFVPNACVVLHASGDSPGSFIEQISAMTKSTFKDFAFLNPTSYHTYSPRDAGNVTGLSTVHSSNFRYINNIISFDIFGMETSNDMFVRKGVENLFENYDCGSQAAVRDIEEWKSRSKEAKRLIDKMSSAVPLEVGVQYSTEGCFYPKEVFKTVSDVVLDVVGGFLAGEEFVLHTLALNINRNMKNVGESYVFHNPNHASTLNSDIDSVRGGEMPNKYVVKRVPRNMNHPCRTYVNKITTTD